MQNRLPDPLDRLFTQTEDAADGCHTYESAVGLVANNEFNIRQNLNAARAAENAYQAARTGKLTAVQAQKTADENARTFIVLVRDILKPHLGASWSQMWSEAGFVSGSLKVPSSVAERLELVMSLKTYLIAHTSYQSEDLEVTPEGAATIYTALSDARATVNDCRALIGTKKTARNTAVTALRKRMRGLIAELTQLLPGDDARWNAFGLNMPDAVGIPDVPEDLTVVGGGSGHLLATWDGAALAERYRVFKKVIGVDSEYVLATTVTETESNLNTFTPGQIVRVRVVAVNDAGASLPSDSVEQTVP
jgi:hypothetical protein